jgi:hypothetical protein
MGFLSVATPSAVSAGLDGAQPALGRGPLVFLPRFHQAPDFEEPYYGALGWGRVSATGRPLGISIKCVPPPVPGGWKSLRMTSGLRQLMRGADS